MNRKRTVLAALVITLTAIVVLVFMQTQLNRIIREDRLVDEANIETGEDPVVAFTTVALGGFRGLVADILWLRALALQDQGKYFELVQLADWIQKLQPKFTTVSSYLAWNMAYNISVTCQDYEDRWRWIHRGVETLRKAIKMSPNDPTLYKELGWIYQHKLGNVLDDAQKLYKVRTAENMMKVFNGREPDLKGYAAAPATMKELLDDKAEIRKALNEMGIKNYKAFEAEFRKTGLLSDVLKNRLPPEDFKSFDDYLRANWLRDEFVLAPEIMLEMYDEFGDVDWLLPETYAVYWAYQGLKHSRDGKDIDCERMIVQSLQVLTEAGRMLMPGDKPTFDFILVPNFSIIDKTISNYRKTYLENPNIPSFKHGYENYLLFMVTLFYTYAQDEKAHEYFNILRDELKHPQVMDKTFDEFVKTRFEADMSENGFKRTSELVTGLIIQACNFIVVGERASANRQLELAKLMYDHFKYVFATEQERIMLPDFEVMKATIVDNLIQSIQRVNPEAAARLRVEIELDSPLSHDDAIKDSSASSETPAPEKK